MKLLKTNFLYTAFVMLALAFTSCETEAPTKSSLNNYVGIETSKYVGVLLDQTVTVDTKVVATDVSNVDRTFNLVVDPSSTHDAAYYNVPATVTIPAGQKVGVFQTVITGSNLGGGKILVVGLETEVGVDYALTGYTLDTEGLVTAVKANKVTYTIDRVCETGLSKVKLNITFDNYPEETAWELYDSSLNVIDSGGFDASGNIIGNPGTGYAALFADKGTLKTSFCLASGDYTFVIYDAYGDGLYTSASVEGNYSVKLGETVLASGQGDFGTSQATTFNIP